MRAVMVWLALSGVALAEPASATASLTAKDRHFMIKVAGGGLAEVALGRLAADKGTTAEVKQYGERMVRDHEKANSALGEVAKHEGVTLPTELPAEEKQLFERLRHLDRKDFDAAYMTAMAKDHDTDVAEFERAAKEVTTPSLRDFVNSTLPVLREHKSMAHAFHTH